MSVRRIFSAVALSLAAVICGCDTVRRAEEAKLGALPLAMPLVGTASEDIPDISFAGFQLPDFVAFAFTNRPNIVAAELAVQEKVLAIKTLESSSPFMPNLSSSIGYGQSTANSSSHFSWRNSGVTSGSLDLDILLFDFGRYDANYRAACENLLAAEMTCEETRLDVFGEVASSYFTMLQNRMLVEVALSNEFEYAEHLAQATNRFVLGEAQQLDVLRARLDLADARLVTVNASNNLVTATAEFLCSLGLEADRHHHTDIAAIIASYGSESELLEFETSSFSAAEALDFARTNSPSLLVKRSNLRAAVHDVDYAISDLFPELSLSTSLSYADPSWNWSWAIRAVQSLFLGYRKTTAVDTAVVKMQSAEAEILRTEQQLSYQITLAVAERDNSCASLASAREAVFEARENLRMVEAQYGLGDVSRIDFTDSVADFTTALGKRVKAFYAGQIAEAELFRLTGGSPVYFHRFVKENQ